MLTVAPIYLALCTFLYLALAYRVIQQRHAAQIDLGDGDDKELRKRIRAHGNFAEYAPLLLILLIVAELQGTPASVLHIAGSLIFISRAAHAYFLCQTPESIKRRTQTMGTTFVLILLLALGVLGHAIF